MHFMAFLPRDKHYTKNRYKKELESVNVVFTDLRTAADFVV